MTPQGALDLAWVELVTEARENGLDPAEAQAFADAMLRTTYGQSLALKHAVADLRAHVLAPLDRLVLWIARKVERRG